MKSITIAGTTYRSISDAARAYGISHSTICHRVERGMSMEEAVTARIIRNTRVTCNGVEYASMADAARANGISPATAYARLRMDGWSAEDAFSHDTGFSPKRTAFEAHGKTFGSIRSACKTFGISEGAMRKRLRAGEDVTDALVRPPDKSFSFRMHKHVRSANKENERLGIIS